MEKTRAAQYPILEDAKDYEDIKAQCEKHKGETLLWILPWKNISLDAPENFNEAYLAHLKTVFSIAETFDIKIFLTPEINLFSLPPWLLAELNSFEKNHNQKEIECNYILRNESDQNCLFSFFILLFFIADVFFPGIEKDGESIKYYLQTHCIAAMKHTARRLKKASNLRGFYFSKIFHPDYVYANLKEIESFLIQNKLCKIQEVLNKETLEINIESFIQDFQSEFQKKYKHYIFIREDEK